MQNQPTTTVIHNQSESETVLLLFALGINNFTMKNIASLPTENFLMMLGVHKKRGRQEINSIVQGKFTLNQTISFDSKNFRKPPFGGKRMTKLSRYCTMWKFPCYAIHHT